MDFSKLKDIRKIKKISQKDLARQISISQAHLSYIERGQRNPTVSVIEEICEALDCELVIIIK